MLRTLSITLSAWRNRSEARSAAIGLVHAIALQARRRATALRTDGSAASAEHAERIETALAESYRLAVAEQYGRSASALLELLQALQQS